MRNNAIDAFRAISIILVTLFHLGAIFDGPGLNRNGFALGNILANGWTGVGVFFVISGFCMGASTERKFSEGVNAKSYLGYFLNRLLRIAPAYYVSMVFWYYIITTYHVAVKSVEPFDIITHLLFIHNLFNETMYSVSGVYWSLAVEMQFYVMLPFLLILLTTPLKSLFYFVSSIILSIVILKLSDDKVITISVVAYLCLFLTGILCYRYRDFVGKFVAKPIVKWSLIVFVFGMLTSNVGVYNGDAVLFEIILSMAFCALLTYSAQSGKVSRLSVYNSRVLGFIGRCSFSIYLYNYLMHALPIERSGVVNFISILLITFAFGIFTHYFFEKPFEVLRKKYASSKRKNVAAVQ